MSEQPDLGHGDGSEPAEPQSQPQESQGEQSRPPFRPLQFLKDKLREAQRRARAGEKYEAFKNAVNRQYVAIRPRAQRAYFRTETALEKAGMNAAHLLDDYAILPLRSGLAKLGKCVRRPAYVNSVAAIAMVFVTAMQWDAIKETNTEMVAQREEMANQTAVMREEIQRTDRQIRLAEGQLAEARAATKQSEAVLQQMRLEQRAWLGVVEPKISPLKIGDPMECEIVIENSGHHPGTIDTLIVDIEIVPKDTDIGLGLPSYSK